MNLLTMFGIVSQRLNEGASGPIFYTKLEIIAALNEANRLFSLLTLGLETTQPWTVPAASPSTQTTFVRMLTVFQDWIAPLRITTTAGAKVRPSRMEDLCSLDAQWFTSRGAPKRYCALGVDLVGIYPQPTVATVLQVTYARAPLALVNDADIPEIPAEYHPELADYAVYRCRQGEGAQEFAKTLPLLNSFLNGATRYGNYVRSRNLGSRYDKVPLELEKFDRSQLLKLRGDLAPERKVSGG
jgi:hypothetical protein